MHRSWRRLAAVLAALVLFTVLPLGAGAKGDEVSLAEVVALRQQLVTAPDFVAAWHALTPAQQRAVMELYRHVNIETSVVEGRSELAAPVTGSCRTVGYTVTARSTFVGGLLWRYTHWLRYCYNGTVITYFSSWPEVYLDDPFWQYAGEVSYSVLGGNGQSYVRAYRQGAFCQYFPTVGCAWYRYPWVTIWAYGNGSWTATGAIN